MGRTESETNTIGWDLIVHADRLLQQLLARAGSVIQANLADSGSTRREATAGDASRTKEFERTHRFLCGRFRL